ncbi:MAG: hypothetical protein MJZ68_08720 [archaeon]|nr:hypothetical protein [archaeon]
MPNITDWNNDAFLNSRKTKGLGYDHLLFGTGLMNDRMVDLTMAMLGYYRLKVTYGDCKGNEANDIKKVTDEEFLSMTFGKQKSIIEYAGTHFDKDSDAMKKILEKRNYFIHNFRLDYLRNNSILSSTFNELKDLILSIRKQQHRFQQSIQSSKSQSKKDKNQQKNNTSKRTLKVDREELISFINECLNEYGDSNLNNGPTISLTRIAGLVNEKYPNIDYRQFGGKNKFKNMVINLGFKIM